MFEIWPNIWTASPRSYTNTTAPAKPASASVRTRESPTTPLRQHRQPNQPWQRQNAKTWAVATTKRRNVGHGKGKTKKVGHGNGKTQKHGPWPRQNATPRQHAKTRALATVKTQKRKGRPANTLLPEHQPAEPTYVASFTPPQGQARRRWPLARAIQA